MTPETADTEPKGSLPASKGIARVHIYGAGIAGLTAAHELAIRGFRVRVIEPAQESNELGQLEGAPAPLDRRMAVGGLARTQFLRAARGAKGNFQAGTGGERSEEFRLFLEYPEDFEPGKPEGPVPKPLPGLLHHYLNRCGFFTRGETQGVLHIRIPPSPDAERQRRRRRNAEALHAFLTATSPWDTKLEPARVIIMEEAEARELAGCLAIPPLELQPQEGLWLELLHLLPGEHGFRFFPSYYRHLFSTMLETPLLDANNQLTGRRVFDNLVPSSFYGIAAQGRRIRFLRRTPSTRPIEMLQELRDLSCSGYPPSDTAQFTLRIWRYMCTSSERRKAEYQRVSWWEYLEGYDPEKGTRRYQYSATFKRDMQFAPRVLAAFDSAWGDARTNGNTLVQLYLNNLLPLPKTDGTLNGPTTLAWLRPWRRYLREYLKVEFHAGELMRLVFNPETKTVEPHWKKRGTKPDEPPQPGAAAHARRLSRRRAVGPRPDAHRHPVLLPRLRPPRRGLPLLPRRALGAVRHQQPAVLGHAAHVRPGRLWRRAQRGHRPLVPARGTEELPELAPLRELDAKLFAAGRPHVWDVLGLAPQALTRLPPLDPLRGAESLLELLLGALQTLETVLKDTVPHD